MRAKYVLGIVSLCLLVVVSIRDVNAQPSGELKIGAATLYDQTFHPIWGTMYQRVFLEPMYDNIIGVTEDGKLDPQQSIASKWEVSADQLKWTFYIRDGVEFHNGDRLTNEDVKYTIEQAGSKKNNAGSQADFKELIEKVETAAPNKVVISLKKPWPTFLTALTTLNGAEGLVQPKNYIEKNGDDYFRKNPVGSGPYKFAEWKEGNYIKLVAQDKHWRVTPKYKYLTFKLMPEEGARVAALRSGEVDVIPVSLTRAKELVKDGYTLQNKEDGLFVGLMWLGAYRPDFATNNKKVRQAITYAIDKASIVKHIFTGYGKVVGSATSMFTWAIEYKPYPPTPFDPAAAKKLLAEAGYPNGFTLNLYSFVTMLPEIKLINETIASNLEAIGVKVKILEMDYNAFKVFWTKQQDPPGPAAFVMAWPNRPVYSWRHMYASDALYSHVKDPKIDKLIDDFERVKTTVDYIAGGQKIMDYVLENYYATGICTTHQLHIIGKKTPAWNMGRGVGSYRWEYAGK
jgi:peptide/nickel transport system substrate-binding protein